MTRSDNLFTLLYENEAYKTATSAITGNNNEIINIPNISNYNALLVQFLVNSAWYRPTGGGSNPDRAGGATMILFRTEHEFICFDGDGSRRVINASGNGLVSVACSATDQVIPIRVWGIKSNLKFNI